MKVAVSLGYTLNTGNYESLKIQISVEDEARLLNEGFETKDQAFDRVWEFVETKLSEKLNDAKQTFGV